MVTLAALGIIIGFGIPRLTGLMDNNRVVATLNHLSAHLSYARSEAIKRSTTVSLIPLVAGNWTQGWQVFVDINSDGVLDPGEAVLKIVDDQALPGTTIVPVGNSVTYNPMGNVSAGETFTLTSPNQVRRLAISITGAVSID